MARDDVWPGTPSQPPVAVNGRQVAPLPNASSDGLDAMHRDLLTNNEVVKFAANHCAQSVLISMRKYFWSTVMARPNLNKAHAACSHEDDESRRAAFAHWNKLWMQLFVWIMLLYWVWFFWAVLGKRPVQALFSPIAVFLLFVGGFLVSHSSFVSFVERPDVLECKSGLFLLWVMILLLVLPLFFCHTHRTPDPHWLWIIGMPIPTMYVLVLMWQLGANAGAKELFFRCGGFCKRPEENEEQGAASQTNLTAKGPLSEVPRPGSCAPEPNAGTPPSSFVTEMQESRPRGLAV